MQQLPTITISSGGEVIPADVYHAEVTDLRVVDNPFEAGRQQIEFHFTIRGSDYDGHTLRAYKSLSKSPKSRLVEWAGVLLGRTLQPGEDLNLADLIGKRCKIVVQVKPKKDGSGQYNAIESLLPLRSSAGGQDPFQQ